MSRVSILLLLLTIFTLNLTAQIISGSVKNEKGTPVGGATISLLSDRDSSIIKLQVSGEDGSFLFSLPHAGQFYITATSIGFQSFFSEVLWPGATVTIVLKDASTELKGVVVTSKKPMIQVKEDRMIINVEGSINATGNTVLELLLKSPSVIVNSEDRISMNGKNGVQIFIDGKPTPLSGDELAAYLKSMQSSEVEAIELITHPSARYEAAGNAGIINIRLKKSKTFGTNGSLTSGYNQGVYGKFNTGISLNHRTAKLNVFGNVSYNGGVTPKKMTVNRRLMDSTFDQSGTLKEKSKVVNIKGGMDYFLNTQNTVGFLINGSFGNTALTNSSYTKISSAFAQPTRILKANNRFASDRDHLDFNLNYLYAGKEGKSLNVNADYGFYNMDGIQLQPNDYFDGSGQNKIHTITYEMLMPSAIDIYSLKWDYEQPFLKGQLGVGMKTAYVKTDNDFQRYTLEQNREALDYGRSNRFFYREAIHAAYLSYSRQWEHVQMQAGLRAENTVMNGTSTGKKETALGLLPFDSTIHQNYLDLFPSMSVNYSKHKNHQFSISLSRRIDRQAYQDLNPFELKVDDYLVQKGNAYLRPQYTTGIGISYVYKQKVNASLNYSHVNDLAAWILDTTETSKSVAYRQNLNSQKLLALNVNYPFQYRSYSLFVNLNGTYSAVKGDFGVGRNINQSAFGMNVYLQNSIKFAKTWSAEVSGFYYAPSLQEGNMQVKSFWSVDVGVQTKLKEDKITLKLSVSDMFNTLQFRSYASFAGQEVRYNTKNETRQIKLSASFRLGSKDVKSARQRASGAAEEMKRVN
jgi:iron complex outermembrane receptor protein